MLDDVNVRVGLDQLPGGIGVKMTGPVTGADPAVSIGPRLAIRKGKAVEHCRLRPPVEHVIAGEPAAEGIGPVAEQRAVQLAGDLAGHGKIRLHDLIRHGQESPCDFIICTHYLFPSSPRRV